MCPIILSPTSMHRAVGAADGATISSNSPSTFMRYLATRSWFDGCAVMMRRLIETLIIECFEKHKIADTIKDPRTGDFLYLADLIDNVIQEPAWNLGRNAKKALPKLKSIGDQSAHNRRYNAHREDIDKLSTDFRNVCQELLYLAGLK